MKLNALGLSVLFGIITGVAVAMPLPDKNSVTQQQITVINYLDNPNDAFPARTQTSIKLEVYSGNTVCYTVPSLAFGSSYLLLASATDPNCKYISRIIVTPLTVQKLQVYGPATTTITIQGSPVTFTAITIAQKPGTENAPIFNDDGTVKAGVMSYVMGSGTALGNGS
jgi:hypothetical protein